MLRRTGSRPHWGLGLWVGGWKGLEKFPSIRDSGTLKPRFVFLQDQHWYSRGLKGETHRCGRKQS